VQLLRLRPAFAGVPVCWVTTQAELSKDVSERLYVVRDANLWDKPGLVLLFLQVGWLMLRLRPSVVVTTGAAPGFAAVFFGRLLGAHPVWIDSIANAEQLSGSGIRVRRWAHVWLTQWEHLATPTGPQYWGSVL
jgi:hypothetical protein